MYIPPSSVIFQRRTDERWAGGLAPNTAQDASDAANACLAQDPAGGVFTPSGTAPSTASATRSASQTSAPAASSSGATSGSVARFSAQGGWAVGVGVVGLVLGGVAVLV